MTIEAQAREPKPLRHLIVATDFTAASDAAIERACLLAGDSGARLTLAHVVPASLWENVGTQLATIVGLEATSPEAMRARAFEQLERRRGELSERYRLVSDARVADGRPAAMLSRIAADENADLLVVGAHGASAVRAARDIILGTTAQELLRVAPCPVLVVKRRVRSPYHCVVAPTDYSASSRAALGNAAAWFPSAQVHVAHAFELPYDGALRFASVDRQTIAKLHATERAQRMERLVAWLDASGIARQRLVLHVEHGYAPKRIDDWTESMRADLVVIASHGKSELEATFLGSVTLHVVFSATCDVLLIRGVAAS